MSDQLANGAISFATGACFAVGFVVMGITMNTISRVFALSPLPTRASVSLLSSQMYFREPALPSPSPPPSSHSPPLSLVKYHTNSHINEMIKIQLLLANKLATSELDRYTLNTYENLLKAVTEEIQLCSTTFFGEIDTLQNQQLLELQATKQELFKRFVDVSIDCGTANITIDAIKLVNGQIQSAHQLLKPSGTASGLYPASS